MGRSSRTSARAVITAIAISAALLLAGCSAHSGGDYSAIAARLQERVLAVSAAVADENWQSASDDLDALDAEVATALVRQQLTAERAEAIRIAIDLVRADVTAALDTELNDAPDPTPTPTDTATPSKPGNGDDNKNENGKKD